MSLIIPGTVTIHVGVVVERRPGVTQWAEFAWRAVEVLEDAPPLAPWTVLREEAGRTLFFAGNAEVAMHPTDTDNYKHNLESSSPSIWVVLRPVEEAPGFKLQTVTVDAGEAHLALVGRLLVIGSRSFHGNEARAQRRPYSFSLR